MAEKSISSTRSTRGIIQDGAAHSARLLTAQSTEVRSGSDCRPTCGTDIEWAVDESDRNCGNEAIFLGAGRATTRDCDMHTFLLDSGASNHMVSDADWLEGIVEIERLSIVLGDGRVLSATHQGD